MIRIQQLKLPVGHTEEELLQRMAKHLRLSLEAFQKQAVRWEIAKRSIDARKKQDVHYVYAIDVELANEKQILRKVDSKNIMSTNPETYRLPPCGSRPLNDPPVVVGAGPAGLFCGLLLARAGYRPVLIERGQDVQSRKASVDRFWQTGELDPSSNVQFGEGGAGTFSDGKLNTLVKDVKGRSRFVLKTFVEFGAPEEILYDSKPHIGTDILLEVVERIREEIISLGGQVLFETCLTGFCWEQGRLAGLWCSQRGASVRIPARAAVLAIGHSARDTFELLQAEGFPMEAKAFAVGLRVEHPQQMISEGQYGEAAGKLPPAPYKVTASLADGRGVYSFCMCPGGYVVNASSEPGGLAVNGMSYSRRDSGNANSAIIVSVTPRDFGGEGALAGIYFQRRLEQRAFALGGGRIPQQLLCDFEAGRSSAAYGGFDSCTRGERAFAPLHTLFPEAISQSFLLGMHQFARRIPGFDRPDCILSGVESRTSSPVRILRNEGLESQRSGIYPCGEGAGYAGGIMSAAMDGMKVAEALIGTYRMNSRQKMYHQKMYH